MRKDPLGSTLCPSVHPAGLSLLFDAKTSHKRTSPPIRWYKKGMFRGEVSMNEHIKRPRHEVVMINRRSLAISGVKNVESFDSEEFLLETEGGFLTIRGQNLHMKNLSLETGEVAIEGLVHEMAYLEQGQVGDRSRGFFGKLFK